MLIGGSPSKLFHLEDFAENLKKKNIETKVVIDTEIYTGFPSKKISNWFESKKKFNQLIGINRNKFFGVGIRNYAPESSKNIYAKDASVHPHQVHFEFLAELGLFGYFCFFYFIFQSLFFSIRSFFFCKLKKFFEIK